MGDEKKKNSFAQICIYKKQMRTAYDNIKVSKYQISVYDLLLIGMDALDEGV